MTGLLLTGGASTRMGRDKATLMLGGETLAARAARVLIAATDSAYVVGPGSGSGLERLADRGEGPLAAIADAWTSIGSSRPAVLVLACDIPGIEGALLKAIAARLQGNDAVVPVANGRDQPLCAAYSADALDAAVRLVDRGERSMRALLASLGRVDRMAEEVWGSSDPSTLDDVDTPAHWEAALDRLSEPPRNE